MRNSLSHWSPLLALIAALIGGHAFADCSLAKIADLPVTMVGMRPTITAQINGADVQMLADSGAFYSVITAAAAAQFKLPQESAPSYLTVTGLGGEVRTSIAIVRAFTLAQFTLPRVQFLVGGSEPGSGAIGVLGQNILGLSDVEYDLEHGAIRLIEPQDCGGKPLAYWDRKQSYSTIDIEQRFSSSSNRLTPRAVGVAYVNGQRIRVLFDTGAEASVLSLRAAARLGVTPNSPGVFRVGRLSGAGRRTTELWVAPFASFKIGDEEIRNTKLRISDLGFFFDQDMLLGADFFLSHHVFVSNQQHKIYFTYSGGPVFNVDTQPAQVVGAQAAPPADDSGDEPKDADGFSRRGQAFAARRDYAHALADLDRACALAPLDHRYVFERGLIHLKNSQPFLAMTDFDEAIKLKPDDTPALVQRAILRLAGHDKISALQDVDAAALASPKEADARLTLATLYLDLDRAAQAVEQYDLWTKVHPDDSRLAQALNGRCWAWGLLNRDLDKALSDCNAAVRMSPKNASPLASRGLVELRLGEIDKAIADYDAALTLQPKIAWAMYGRGLAKLKKGMTVEGGADLSAALALQPRLAERAKLYGLAP